MISSNAIPATLLQRRVNNIELSDDFTSFDDVVAVKTTSDDANTKENGESISNRMETSASDERQQCIICNVLFDNGLVEG